MGEIKLKNIFTKVFCFCIALFSEIQCMDEHTDKLELDTVHHTVNVMNDDQKLIDRITKKIDKYERKAVV